MPNNNRCAIYARCSTGEQNPAMQITELREYAERRGFQIVAEHVDIASGSLDSRPELNKVLVLAKQRKIDVLLCWKIIGSMAQFERDLIRERTLSGMAAARRRGARIGRPRVDVDSVKIRGLRSQGLSWDAIAIQTGISRETCRLSAK